MRMVYIYGLKDPRNDTIFYVGKSICPKKRLYHHLRDKKNLAKAAWIEELSQRGLVPALVILQETDKEEWQEMERSWIAKGRECGWPLTNIHEGGCGGTESKKPDFDFFASFLSPKLKDVFQGLSTVDKRAICRATAMAMMQHSYIAIKAKGGDPKKEFDVDFEFLVGQTMAQALLEAVSDNSQFDKLLDEVNEKGDTLVAQIDAFISFYEG